MKIIIQPKRQWSINFGELIRYHEIFYYLAWRDIKVRYKQTAIGITWAILQPLLTMVIFTLIFKNSFGTTVKQIPYSIFALSGLLFWSYFSSAIAAVGMSFYSNRTIITKVYFPRIIIPVSAAIVPLVDFIFACIPFLLLVLYFHVSINIFSLIAGLSCILLAFICVIAFGLTIAILNVKYRDVQYALPFIIQIMLFATPVIYPINTLVKAYQILLYINPMTGIIELARYFLFHTTTVNFIGLAISFGVVLFSLLVGVVVFNRYEAEIADTL